MIRNLHISFIVIVSIFASACAQNQTYDLIAVKGRNLMVNNKTFTIKGVCYHPVPKGSNQRDFSNLTQDLALMKELGVNTIRVYVPIDDIAVLDEINEAGIKIIMGIGYNQEGNFDILSGTYLDYINKYKNHNAILLWELGNEYNYHPEWFEGDIKNWYMALNKAAKNIKEVDKNHPITTAHGELPDDLAFSMATEIDVWGINIYRWDNPGTFFEQWKNVSDKPMYFSEAGADSYMTIAKDQYTQGSNELAQADAVKNILEATLKSTDICSGVTLYAFVDEWWKAGDNNKQDPGGWAPNSSGVPYDGTPNEEYWGVLTIERNKKKVFDVVKHFYTKLN
ncbi:MAG: hypothetical protein KGZ87_09495 [Bacteroidetes bacterium]|jgi:beta-galactosidase/beta-glucuronidase|nr:hypothetical protein [Bacteroidota bacterium]